MADHFGGAIFDVDGVLVDSPHEQAWRDALKELMETQWSDIRAAKAGGYGSARPLARA